MNPVLQFIDAANRGDLDGISGAFHPEFEMEMPQAPSRGFKGRGQVISSFHALMDACPKARIEVLKMMEMHGQVWVETRFDGGSLEIAATTLCEVDAESNTIIKARSYSAGVDRGETTFDDWIHDLVSNG